MKKILLAMAVTAGVFITNISIAQTRAPQINHKSVQQNMKIRDGIHKGAITRPEAQHLRMKQAEIHGMKKMAMADGRFTHRERKLIRKEQKHLDRLTFAKKHNHRHYR